MFEPRTIPFDPVKVHGLVPVRSRMLAALPITLGDDQTAWTCLCGRGWLTIGSDETVARENLHAHMAG